DVLARDTHPGVFAVELVELVQVRDEHAVDFRDGRRRQVRAGFQVMADLAEHPGPALGGPADHHGIRLRVIKDLPYLFRRAYVAVGNYRYRRLALDRRDGLVLRLAGEAAGAGAAVYRE